MIKNIVANWSITIVSALAVFVLYPFFVGLLGEEQYGVWLLIASITGYFTMIQMGVPLANVRYVSKYYAQSDYEKLNEVLGVNLFLFICMAGVTLLIGCGLALILDRIFQIPQEYVGYAKVAMLLSSLEIALRFIFEAVESVLHARQEFVIISIVKNIMILCRVGLSFWLVTYDYGLIWIASLLLLSTVVEFLFFYAYVKKKYPQLHFIPRMASKKVLLEIFGYSSFVLLLQLASRISFQTDTLVLASVVSVASVVWFGVANNMLLYLTQFVTSISKVLMPTVSELDAVGKPEVIRNHYLRLTRIVGLLVFPICLGLHLFGHDFISLWMGEGFNETSSQVLSILALGYSIFLVQRAVGFPIFMGTSEMKVPTIMMFIAALINLLLSIWWGKVYGVIGVAWGTTVPTLMVSLALVLYVRSLLKIGLTVILYETLLLPVIGLIPLYLAYMATERLIHMPSFLGLTFKAFICGVIYFCFSYFLLDKSSRHWVNSLFRS